MTIPVPSESYHQCSVQNDAPSTAVSFPRSSALPLHRNSLSPKNAAPNSAFSNAETPQTEFGRSPLNTSHDLARRQGRRPTDKNVHMIFADNAFHDPYLKSRAGLPHQLPHTLRDFSRQHLVAVFRHPHKVVLNLINRMAAITLLHRTSSIHGSIVSAKADRLKPVV